jgi:hypothetical protein
MVKFHAIVVCLLLSWAGARAQESLFPSVTGWKLSNESRVYDANDLWDIIDGAADLYLEYGFVDLHRARYTTENNREVKAELYRHRDAENAFGIYAAERSPENNFIAVGSQGYQQTSILNFVAGEFYVKLSSRQSDPASAGDLLAIAKGMEKQLDRSAAFPATLRLFPLEGKLANSEQFIAQNFLGYGFLRSVYTASYGGSAPFKAFIIGMRSGSDADTLIAMYLSKLPKETITALGAGRFDLQDPNNGQLSIAREGAYIVGIVNCTDDKMKNELLAGLKKNCLHP